MPMITVQMFAGRPVEKKREFVAALTKTACDVLGCSPSAVTIILQDVEKHDWADAGVLYADMKPGQPT